MDNRTFRDTTGQEVVRLEPNERIFPLNQPWPEEFKRVVYIQQLTKPTTRAKEQMDKLGLAVSAKVYQD